MSYLTSIIAIKKNVLCAKIQKYLEILSFKFLRENFGKNFCKILSLHFSKMRYYFRENLNSYLFVSTLIAVLFFH
jgi:hypothetical protein